MDKERLLRDLQKMSLAQKVQELARLQASLTQASHSGASEDYTSIEFLASVKEAGEKGPPEVYSTTVTEPLMTKLAFSQWLAQARAANGALLQTMNARFVHGRAPDLMELKPITIREIATAVNKPHTGRVLFGKTAFFPAGQQVSVGFLLQDSEGEIMQTYLYNFLDATDDPAEEIPEGTCFALLEPYMKNARDSREYAL